jgi:hypothetical protein
MVYHIKITMLECLKLCLCCMIYGSGPKVVMTKALLHPRNWSDPKVVMPLLQLPTSSAMNGLDVSSKIVQLSLEHRECLWYTHDHTYSISEPWTS